MPFSTKKYLLEREYPLTKEIVWKLLSDTDRLNRFIGLFPIQFKQAKKENGEVFYREAFAKVAGLIPISWREYPFEWKELEYYSVERIYQDGPLKHFIGGVELEELGLNRTKVRLFSEFTPKNVIGITAIPITGLSSMKKTMKYIDDYLTQNHNKKQLYSHQKSTTHKMNTAELIRLENRLKDMPIQTEYIDFLHKHLFERYDHEVVQMRPKSLAKEWGVDPNEVLRLCLYATKVGILNLSWNLICPNCRVSKEENNSLAKISGAFHCDLCGINYDVDFENSVELSFSVHPAIRNTINQMYCVGGPMITPHVKIQKVIKKGEEVILTVSDFNVPLRLRILQVNHIVSFVKKGAKILDTIEYGEEGWSHSEIMLKDNQQLHVENTSSSDIVLVVEQAEWSKEVVTAARVTAMQEFRDLFSSEVLAPGQQVGIENVTILFSDLQGSTSLYEIVGDANAYGQVRRHFEFLTYWIAKNSGSVVKTIGDAVMAVFHLPEDGLKAALDIQQHVHEFNREGNDNIILKIGLYSGPAIAVNSNERLDYFGRTVNISSRIQGQSFGGDVVISKDYLKMEATAALLEDEHFELSSFGAELKGIKGNVDLIRVHWKEDASSNKYI